MAPLQRAASGPRMARRHLIAAPLFLWVASAAAHTEAAAAGTASAPGSTPSVQIGTYITSPGAEAVPAASERWSTKSFAELMQGIAFVAAAGFFGWKWTSGYHALDMSLAISTRRFRRPAGDDQLVVSLSLTKGTRESALVRSIKLYLYDPNNTDEPTSVEITDAQLVAAKRAIRLTPGEATAFEHLFEIDPHASVKVAAEVVATSGFFDLVSDHGIKGYWRCTAISVPEEAVRASNPPAV